MKIKVGKTRISKYGEIAIRLAAAGALLAVGVIAPNVLGASSKLVKQFEDLRELAAKADLYLKKRIDKMVDENIFQLAGDEVKLTAKGKKILKLLKLSDIKLEKQEIWDGIWHLVSYDIPEVRKDERDDFRLRIQALGFKQIQDSLWAYPYECREEIAIITKTLSISRYVAYLTTNHLPRQGNLIKFFNLKTT